MSDDEMSSTDPAEQGSEQPEAADSSLEAKRPRVQPVPPEFEKYHLPPTQEIDGLPDTQPDVAVIDDGGALPPTQAFSEVPPVQPVPPEFVGGLPQIQEVDPLFVGLDQDDDAVTTDYTAVGSVYSTPAARTSAVPATPTMPRAGGPVGYGPLPQQMVPSRAVSSGSSVRVSAVAAIVALLCIAGGAGWWYWQQQTSPDPSPGRGSEASIVVDDGPDSSTTASSTFGTDDTSAPEIVTVPTTNAVPTTSVAPAPTTPPPTSPPPTDTSGSDGDLGLGQAMRRPACDGKFIVITANAVTPGLYEQEVSEALGRFVGAAYLRTDQTCPSLRGRDDLGNPIYSVYYGAFPSLQEACGIRDQVGGESYVKVLDQTTSPDLVQRC